MAGDVYVSQPLTREKLCVFIASLAVDLGDRGRCLVESPLVERDVCYTSSNHLAYYALRYVCRYRELADLVYKFLESYPTDFYDYHQVLVGKPIPFLSRWWFSIICFSTVSPSPLTVVAPHQSPGAHSLYGSRELGGTDDF
jgi:hypothetical protein